MNLYEKPDTKVTKVYLPTWLHRELKIICAKRDLNMNFYLQTLVIEALLLEIKKEKK